MSYTVEIEADGSHLASHSREFVKIGWARNLRGRMADVQTCNPHPPEGIWICEGDERLERALHRQFDEFHHRGEWFRRVPEIEAHFRECCDEYRYGSPQPRRPRA